MSISRAEMISVAIVFCIALVSCDESEPSAPAQKKKVAYVTTFAGSTEGFEDGPLLTAKFRLPDQIVRTSTGNFYVLDQDGTVIRKITPDGMVSTIPYNLFNPSYIRSIALDDQDNLYFNAGSGVCKLSDAGSMEVIAIPTPGEDDTYFNDIYGMAFHPDGYLYAAESTNSRIMKISKDGEVSKFAGGDGYVDGNLSDARFGGRQGLIIAPNGDIFLADYDNHKYRKISGGKVITYAGDVQGHLDGPALKARFGTPRFMALTKDGTMYVTGTESYIREISPDGMVKTIAGSLRGLKDGIGTNAYFTFPAGLVLDQDENLFIADYHNDVIRKIEFKYE